MVVTVEDMIIQILQVVATNMIWNTTNVVIVKIPKQKEVVVDHTTITKTMITLVEMIV